jgi:hypothetical protein
MSLLSRLIANLLLPLLLFISGYLLLFTLGEGLISTPTLYVVAILIALLLAALPPLLFTLLIRSQLQKGFALLKDGDIVTHEEITLGMILGNRITAWRLYQQHLSTEVCLQGSDELIYVQMDLKFQIPATDKGKQFIKHFKHNITVFEAWVQRAIYLASLQDRELVEILPADVLLNEDDERVLRSKFLSALEAQPLESIRLPLDTSSLTVNRRVRCKPKADSPLSTPPAELTEEQLSLDSELVAQLGLQTRS